ncbi:major facilitator superfamily domain-containing protein [Parachaetomium inaequale]|uniref:Major facilitator superfamily domain-containing protein n=1 Tax=Parachaetomium inaequale TaxID=2588326 RepID=A0AAN6SWC5_9PEZI|nr:major facilitator superfamily domain-containing protein [Parachaetomium inaequale]
MPNQLKKGPKLPAQQLAILAVARFAEPLALTSVFPYLPEMIASFGVEKDEVARWAGFTGAIFSICQSCTAVAWGRASDRFGRKPIILMGLASTMICFVLWGMSTSLAMAITIRAIMGGGNGNVGIIRTMVAEMVPERSLQPKAFSLMPLVWSIGSVFGPAFGGFFARPAEQYPDIFGRIEYFKHYPFALPNLMACCVFFVSFMTGLLFLKETLHSKRYKRDWGLLLGEKLTRPFKRPKTHAKRRRLSFVDDEASAPLLADSAMSSSEHIATKEDEPVSHREIFTTQTSINLLSYTFLALHAVAYDQVLPVFLNYPRVVPDETNTHLPFRFNGGFGLSSDKIGTIYTIYGIACGVVQFLLFPTLCARFGVLTCYRFATMVFPVIYLLTPYTALIQDTTTRYAVFLILMFVKGFVVIIGFPCTTILLTNSASSLRILGTLNGFATTFSGLGRAIGPAVAGAVFSWGAQRGYAIAPWWLLAAIAAVGAVVPWFIVEGEGPGRSLGAGGEEDDDAEEGERESLLRGGRGGTDTAAFVSDDEEEDRDVALLEAVGEGSDSDEDGARKKGYGTVNGAASR